MTPFSSSRRSSSKTGEISSNSLHSVSDGLCRISEQHRWAWDTLGSLPGVGVAATHSSPQNRLDSPSSSVTTGFGDIKTTKLDLLQRALAQSTWRLLGQLASSRRVGSKKTIETLIAIGREAEAAAAVDLALVAASQDCREAKQGTVIIAWADYSHCVTSSTRHGSHSLQRLCMAFNISSPTSIMQCRAVSQIVANMFHCLQVVTSSSHLWISLL